MQYGTTGNIIVYVQYFFLAPLVTLFAYFLNIKVKHLFGFVYILNDLAFLYIIYLYFDKTNLEDVTYVLFSTVYLVLISYFIIFNLINEKRIEKQIKKRNF